MSGPGSYLGRLEGNFDGRDLWITIVVSRFHLEITETLLERCTRGLHDHGVPDEQVRVVRVPGAWELPQAAALVAKTGRADAIVALGCVIRGDTPHFDFVAGEAARGLGAVGRESGVPVILGLLTTDTEAQARERADPDGLDKGREAALAALEMALLFREVP